MKPLNSLALLATLALGVSSVVLSQSGGKPTIAVFSFENGAIGKAHDELEPLRKGIADLLIGELAANAGIRVIERDQIQKLLEEQKLTTANLTDPATAVRVGKLLGVHHMVFGGFMTDRSGTMRLSPRVVLVETGLIEFPNSTATAAVTGKTDDFMELITQMAAKLNKGLKLPDLPARVGEARQEAAKKVPYEAIALYSRALAAKDAKNTAEYVTLLRQTIEKYPTFDQAAAELKKVQ